VKTASKFRRSALILALAPLALGLAACNGGGDASATLDGKPIAKIAAPAGKAWADVVSLTADAGYLMGNPDAPIKLIEYGSLTCPHCAKLAMDGFSKLKDDYVASGRVSFEFRSYAIHPQDVPLTVLASCGEPEAFIPRAEQIYGNFNQIVSTPEEGLQRAQQALSLPDNQRFVAMADALGYTDFFASRGLAKDQANACLAKIENATAVAKRAEKIKADGIDGTPTLLVNGVKLDVPVGQEPWDVLESALQRAGARDK
jgi:protein-disulfide isomerase